MFIFFRHTDLIQKIKVMLSLLKAWRWGATHLFEQIAKKRTYFRNGESEMLVTWEVVGIPNTASENRHNYFDYYDHYYTYIYICIHIYRHYIYVYICIYIYIRGTAVAQRLRYCAIKRKVAGSIPGGVTGIFHWHNLSDRTMALGSTQPLTEMSARSISWGKGGRCVRLTTLPCRCHVIWEP
jgi:hypothetical protein